MYIYIKAMYNTKTNSKCIDCKLSIYSFRSSSGYVSYRITEHNKHVHGYLKPAG